MATSEGESSMTSETRRSLSPSCSRVYFYSPRIPRKHQDLSLQRRQQQHEDQMQSKLSFDKNIRHLSQPSHSLSTFSSERKSPRNSPMDTVNRFKCLQEDRNTDKIAIHAMNQSLGVTGALDPRLSSPSSTSSSSSRRHVDPLVHHLLPATPVFPADSTDARILPVNPVGVQALPIPPPVVSQVSPQMEHEIQSLNLVIDYINTELQALVTGDEEEDKCGKHPSHHRHRSRSHDVDGEHRLLSHRIGEKAVAGHSNPSLGTKDHILVHHLPNQQEDQGKDLPDEGHLPAPGDQVSDQSRLTFCQKYDSADTVIDGGSSKDMSSSADFSDENDMQSKIDLTTSEDELVDEGIQCNSGDQMISFNHMTVLEIEAFLRKYRDGDPQKDEGKDSILFFPDFVRDVMEFLVKHGLKKEGIFRRSGVKSRINLLMNSSYFSGSAGSNNNNSLNQSQESVLEEACAYDVADFLKGWFRNQDPLLTVTIVSNLLPLVKKSEAGDEEDWNVLRAHLLVLPNRIALEALIRFLSKFAARSDHNSMSAGNLAIVWTPSVCREGSHGHATPGPGSHSLHSSSTSASILESVSSFMKDARYILEFLLHHVDRVFSIPRLELESLPKGRIPNGPSMPSILCRSSKVMAASPYEVFLKVVINRSWDPLVVETSDDGESQRIRHSFSRFVPNGGSIRIKRQLNRPSPTDETIQIHEESVDDGRSYSCDWLITSSASGVSPSKSSEVTLSLFYDLRGRPLVWYKKSFPRLLETYLSSISSSFPGSKNDRSLDRASAPFSCCFFMRQAVNA